MDHCRVDSGHDHIGFFFLHSVTELGCDLLVTEDQQGALWLLCNIKFNNFEAL